MRISIIKEYNEEISKFLFNLRNKNFVRRSSLSKTKIKLHQHKIWIKKFFKKKNILYVVRIKDKPVGYVRMEKNRNQ